MKAVKSFYFNKFVNELISIGRKGILFGQVLLLQCLERLIIR